MKRPCKICGVDIICFPSTYNKKKYCSKECREQSTHFLKECLICGKVYSVARSRYKDGKNIRHKVCSEECRLKYHKDKLKTKKHFCLNCGISFIGNRNNNKTGLIFCSRDCSKIYMKGAQSPFYNNGIAITTQGYRAIKIGSKYVLEHRLIMEEYLWRKLKKEEVVHHIDGNKINNSLKNLKIMLKQEHDRYHTIERHKKEACFGKSKS